MSLPLQIQVRSGRIDNALQHPKRPHFRKTTMNKYLVLYLAPTRVIEEWKKTEATQKKAAEDKMMQEWKAWMASHMKMFADPGAGAGKTKRITAQGMSDSKNDVMLYAIVSAESHDAAAKSFVGHPHLQIPEASIEVMELHALPGMERASSGEESRVHA